MFQAKFKTDSPFQAEFKNESVSIEADFSSAASSSPGGNYRFGSGLKYDALTNIVSVDTAQTVIAGDVRPVSASAVHTEIGNIEALLSTI